MTDDEMYRVLNDFARQHALAEGLEVNVSCGGKSFKTIDFTIGGKYEYSHILSDYINGAEQFLMWARRNNLIQFKPERAKSVAMGSTVSPTPCDGVGERSNRSSHRFRKMSKRRTK